MQVRHPAAAATAAKMLAEQNCRTVVAEAFDVVGGVENTLVFATPADGNERHLRINELAECFAAVARRTHEVRVLNLATWVGTSVR